MIYKPRWAPGSTPLRHGFFTSDQFELRDFVTRRMQMSHIYQPAMLLELLRSRSSVSTNSCTTRSRPCPPCASKRSTSTSYAVRLVAQRPHPFAGTTLPGTTGLRGRSPADGAVTGEGLPLIDRVETGTLRVALLHDEALTISAENRNTLP